MTSARIRRAAQPPPRTGNLELDRYLQSTHEASQVREGVSRHPGERFVTVDELGDAGVVQVLGSGRTIAVPRTQVPNPGDGSIPLGPPDLGQNDFAKPPTARNVRARGVGPKNIMVGWQIPAYTNAYYTEIFRTPTSDRGQLTATLDDGKPYNQSDNNSIYYRGRSFGNSFIDRILDEEAAGPWFYWVRFITAALVPGEFNEEPAQASKNFVVEDWLENFSGSIPVLMDENGNLGLRGDLVVGGMLTAEDADIRGLLTANEIWAKSIVGLEATFDSVIGQRIIVGPRYMQDQSGARVLDPADTPLNGTSGQWRLALGAPLSGYNVGTDGIVRIIHYYKPTYSGGVEAAVVPGSNEAFYLDNQGNVFIGGNLTVRTQGSPGLPINGVMLGMGFNGNGANNAPYYRNAGGTLVEYAGYNRFAMWVGRKSDYVNDGARESNGIFWIREGVDDTGSPRAGFNAELFLGGAPFSPPSIIGMEPNPGASLLRSGDGRTLRATSLVQDAVSAGIYTARTYFNALGVEQFPPTIVNLSVNLVSHDSGTTDNGNSKFVLVTAEMVPAGNTAQVAALIQQVYLDDWSPESGVIALTGVVQLPAGDYKIRVRVKRLDDRNMSIIKGWRCMVYSSVASGDFNLVENGSVVGKDWPAITPLSQQGYFENPDPVAFGDGSGWTPTNPMPGIPV